MPVLQIPDNGLSRLGERILLFRHDYCSPNVLQLINAASDVTDETLVEIVLTASRESCITCPVKTIEAACESFQALKNS